MRRSILLIFSTLLIFSCTESAPSEQQVPEKIKTDDVADIIRIPVSAEEEIDTEYVPKMTFDEMIYDFGTVKEGDIVEHTFRFKNTGEVPLLIGDARTTCGCTVPTYTTDYIKPGKGGKIKVVFDTKNLSGSQTKPITIVSNTYPRDTKLHIKGIVDASGSHRGHNH